MAGLNPPGNSLGGSTDSFSFGRASGADSFGMGGKAPVGMDLVSVRRRAAACKHVPRARSMAG
jgi:hypothetical protein